MSSVVVGNRYLYRSAFGQAYQVEVLRTWWLFALVKYGVTVHSFSTYDIIDIHWKPTWRMFE